MLVLATAAGAPDTAVAAAVATTAAAGAVVATLELKKDTNKILPH
jgi:hypothetical protein